nr:hypothetical protein OG409_23660 [Streptomyces sp. NBC_00974]
MKLNKRMAIVAAAAVLGPTALTATPAMADETKNAAVTTPDSEPKDDATPGEASNPAFSGPKISLDGLPKGGFAAGGGWTELNLHVDNTGKAQQPEYDLQLLVSGTDRPIKGAHVELERLVGGAWQPALRDAGPSLMTAVFHVGTGVQKNKAFDVPVRMRVAADAAAAPISIHLAGTNYTSVDSVTQVYESRITRADGGEQTAKGPKLSLEGLPHESFRAGDRNARTLTLRVDNRDRASTGEYHVGVQLVPQAGERFRADQVEVEFLATNTAGQSYWHPVEVTEEDGALKIFGFEDEYAAGEQRDLVFSVRFKEDTPSAVVALNLRGAGNPHNGGAVSDLATYYTSVDGTDETKQVDGPRMTLAAIPAAGFQAGADWQNFTLNLDNTGKAGVGKFVVVAHLGRNPAEYEQIRASQVQLQALGSDGWYDVDVHASDGSLEAVLDALSLKPGAKASVDLRIRFTRDTTPGPFQLSFRGEGRNDAPHETARSWTGAATTITAAATGTGNTPKPDGGVKPVVDKGGHGNTGNQNTAPAGGQLAETGADAATSWALGAGGVALAMGAALVAGTGRRRRPTA